MPWGAGDLSSADTGLDPGHDPGGLGQPPDDSSLPSPKTPKTPPAPALAARLSRSPSLDAACKRPEWPGELGPALGSTKRRWRSTEDVLSPTSARGGLQAFRMISPLHSMDAAPAPPVLLR